MMAEGRKYISSDPAQIGFAGLALMLLVLAINLVGDGIRARLAPDMTR